MKKYVITGSIGHISKPVIVNLVKAGKEVKVITSSADKVKDIESLGAKTLVGSIFDAAFLKEAFKGAEVVYTMVPPIWQTNDWRASQDQVAANYTEGIQGNSIRYVVNLSSIGAHLSEGCGPVSGLYHFEQRLNNIPGLNVKHLRPAFFYYNFLGQIPLVKQAGIFGANYGEGKVPLVHPRDIAAAATEELLTLDFKGNSVRYIVSDERKGSEIAAVLGKAIGRDVPWVDFSDEDQKNGLLQAGLSETHTKGYVEMGNALRSGKMREDMAKVKPAFAPTKLEDFATEFSAAYSA